MAIFGWIAAAITLFLILFFRPSALSRWQTHVKFAADAFLARKWDAFDRHIALARETAAAIKKDPVRLHSLAETHLLEAQAAYRRGNPDPAVEELKQAVDKIERAQAPDRAARLMFARQLWGEVFFDNDQWPQAIEQFQLAARAVQDFNGPLAIFALQRWSDALLDQGDFDAAREVAERCVDAERQILSNSPSPSISMTAPDLALARREFASAERLFREKAEYWGRMVPPPDNIDVTRYFFHMAAAQEALGRFDEARATLEKACDVARLDFGPGHPRVAKARRKLERLRSRLVAA